MFGAYFSMNRSPLAFSSQAPSPRAPSVIRIPLPASVVGWYWIISMSISLAPIRYACAIPSPVTISPLVVGLYACPAPPVARIVFLALNTSRWPSRRLRPIAPMQRPSIVLQQIGREPLLVAVDLLAVLHQLLVEHVQDRVTGDVGDVVGAGGAGAAKGTGPEVTGLAAVEGDAGVLEPQDLVGRLAAHDLDRVLVAEVVRALDRVVRVGLPRVLGIERRVDPAGGCDRVRADGMDLRDDRDRRPGLRGRERRTLACQACTDNQNVVGGHDRRFY